MLDIKKLKDKIDEILSSYDEEKTQQWFDFDDNRKLTQKEWENKLKQVIDKTLKDINEKEKKSKWVVFPKK